MSSFIESYERVLNQAGEVQGDAVYFFCPFPGCEGYPKRKFHINPERGGWNCWHCHQAVPGKVYRPDAEPAGGSWQEFATLMDDDLSLWPDGVAVVAPKPRLPVKAARQVWLQLFAQCTLAPESQAEMADRGIDAAAAGMVTVTPAAYERFAAGMSEQQLEWAGLAYQTEPGSLRRRSCVSDGRLLIPYKDPKGLAHFVGYQQPPGPRAGQTTTEYEMVRSAWAKYSGPAGYTPPPFGQLPTPCPHAWITEGHLKQLAAAQTGLPILGLQGMGNGHAAVVRRCKESGVEHAFLIFDTSLAEQELVDFEEERLARLLIAAGIRPYRCRLPLDPAVDGGEKMDVDAYLVQFGTPAFAAQLLAATARPYLLNAAPVEGEA